MAAINVRARATPTFTHEGAPAALHLTPEQQLRRSVCSCLLGENEFYESGQEISQRISELAAIVPPQVLADLAVEARHKFNLRHAPLWLLCSLVKSGAGTSLVSRTIEKTISRADELTELIALYWKNGKRPLSAQMKKGVAAAFTKFDEYQLGKYDRANQVRLRDVLFITHAKPKDEEQAALWKRLVDNQLTVPDTWEVALSGGADKRETFERLIRERKLGYLALLRNLRNMVQANVDTGLMREAIIARRGAERVLPFRYVAAARACPQMEPALDEALSEAIAGLDPLPGNTAVLVDVSGSMSATLSARSDLTRLDAAAALASIIPGNVRMFTFSQDLVEIPPRRGMAGIDAIKASQPHAGTNLFPSIDALNRLVNYDRLIVVTDEQAHSWMGNRCPDPKGRGYLINVASAKNGVGYGNWVHLDGFSEQVLRWIGEYERSFLE
jgi:60 kDa SS-A/Ro ribonucleoprotein